MTPQMHETLYRLGVFYDPDPAVVFQCVVQAVSDYYGGAMSMINLADEKCVQFRAVVNPHPALAGITALPLGDTY